MAYIKGRADYHDPSSWNVICDRCKSKRKAKDCAFDGYQPNLFVCKDRCWDPYHPQDDVTPVADEQSVPVSRPLSYIDSESS